MLLFVVIILFFIGFIFSAIEEIHEIIKNKDWGRVVSHVVVFIMLYLIYIVFIK